MNTDTLTFLDRHYRQLNGANLKKQQFPISASLGTGYQIEHKGKKLRSIFIPFLNTGKRKITFKINSYRGLSIGATHYYCTVMSYIEYEVENQPGICVGGTFDNNVPQEYKTLSFEIVRPLTAREKQGDPERWLSFDEGDSVIAFEDKRELLDIISRFRTLFDQKEWFISIEDWTQ